MTNIVPPACLRLHPRVRVIPFILNNSPQDVNVHKISASHTNPENELRVLGSNSTFPAWPSPPVLPVKDTRVHSRAMRNKKENAMFQ